MHESPVRVELPQLQEGVVRRDVGHVKAAHYHIVRAAAKFELVELIHRREAMLEAREHGVLQLRRAKLAFEIEAEALLREVGERATENPHAAVLLETVFAVGPQPFNGRLDLACVVEVRSGHERNTRQVEQRGAHLRTINGVRRDRLAHDRRGDDVRREHVGARSHFSRRPVLFERSGAEDGGFRNGDRPGINRA